MRKHARLSAVGWPPRCLVGRVFVRGIVLVCAPPDVHGWCARVRVPLPRLWVVSSVDRAPGYEPGCRRFESCAARRERGISHAPVSCAASVVYVTVCARVVGLRASRWMRYCVLIAARCPPGLPSYIVPVAELADALDLGSSAFGRVGSTPTGHTGWPFGVGLAKIEYVNVPVVEFW